MLFGSSLFDFLNPRDLNRHSCHRLYSIYIYTSSNCRSELLSSTELHDYQDNDSPILGLTWSLGIFTASHSGSTYTATRGIVQGSPGLVKFNPFGFSQPRFPQRLGSRRTSGLQSDHNERRLWLHWMGYIWIRFSVGFFLKHHIFPWFFAILRFITCWKPLLVGLPTEIISNPRRSCDQESPQGGRVSMKMFPEIMSPTILKLHGEFQKL